MLQNTKKWWSGLFSFVFFIRQSELFKFHLKVFPDYFPEEVLLGSPPRCEPGRWYISRHRISSAHAILSCGWCKSHGLKKYYKIFSLDHREHYAPETISTSRNPTNVLGLLRFENLHAELDNFLDPGEGFFNGFAIGMAAFERGHVTINTPSSSVSMMMGAWIVFIL